MQHGNEMSIEMIFSKSMGNEIPVRSKALAKSTLRRKAFWFQELRLKE
jgi:hypothetical protein